MSGFKLQVNNDFRSLVSNVSLRVGDSVGDLLLMQSVIGHAQNNHGKFYKAYPNATLDDVAIALDVDPVKIRRERQRVIDSIVRFTSDIIVDDNYSGYVDIGGSPLLSLTIPIELEDPSAVLKGIYLAGLMDNFEWRTKAMNEYGVEIGGGECVAVDLDVVRMFGLTLEDLAEGEWSDVWMKNFRDNGVVLDNKVNAVTNKIISAYIRHRVGKGTSDDLAIVLAGKLYGKDAAVGVFLCDAIDTWDKYAEVLVPGGQDEYLGNLIKQHEDVIKGTYPGFELPSDEDVVKFIHTIALQKDKRAISNSQRYLLQVDRKSGQSAIESHLSYVEGRPYRKMDLGHIKDDATNVKLYKLFEERFEKNYLV